MYRQNKHEEDDTSSIYIVFQNQPIDPIYMPRRIALALQACKNELFEDKCGSLFIKQHLLS